MKDRGMIKWAPFNSVANVENIINKLEYKKRKVSKPVLSDDQTVRLNKVLLEAFQTKSIVLLKYYLDGYSYFQRGGIERIDSNKRFFVINEKTIFFSQLIAIRIE